MAEPQRREGGAGVNKRSGDCERATAGANRRIRPSRKTHHRGESQKLFRLVQTDKLRVFVRVPQNYARGASVGQSADLTLPELPGRKFEAKVVRTAGALDAATRTLLTKLEVDNSQGEILAGSYAQVPLAEATAAPTLTLPSNPVVFRSEGPQVAVVAGGKIAMHRVTGTRFNRFALQQAARLMTIASPAQSSI